MRLIQGDCLRAMAEVEDGSVDLILADLPYGTTACKWDVIIPFEPLWAHYRRVLKPKGAVVLTACQPFTSMLVMSNPKWFRYSMAWDKKTTSGFLNAKKMPLRGHEDICVFYRKTPTYHPQMTRRTDLQLKRLNRNPTDKRPIGTDVYRPTKHGRPSPDRKSNLFRYPDSVIRISAKEGYETRRLHSSKKPVELGAYLIRTYSNPGDVVMDNAMGSGSFGVAAIREGRDFIGIEKDPGYFAIAEARLACASAA